MTDATEMQAVLGRLEKLERQNRRLRRLGFAPLLLIGGVLLVAQCAPSSRTVQAQRFDLLDSAGRTRAELSMLADGPALKLYDSQQNARAILSVYQNTPNLGLYDPTGVARIGLTNNLQDGPSLWLGDASGQPQAPARRNRGAPSTLSAGQRRLGSVRRGRYTAKPANRRDRE